MAGKFRGCYCTACIFRYSLMTYTMTSEINHHQRLLDLSVELTDTPNADFTIRELAKIPLLANDEGSTGFDLYRDTTATQNRHSVQHRLDFHAFAVPSELLGVELPLLMNSVCTAWESPGFPTALLLRKQFGGQETQNAVAQLLNHGLMEDPATAELMVP